MPEGTDSQTLIARAAALAEAALARGYGLSDRLHIHLSGTRGGRDCLETEELGQSRLNIGVSVVHKPHSRGPSSRFPAWIQFRDVSC